MLHELGPHPVHCTEHVWIPTRDGTQLAARVWRPVDDSVPVPAILDCHPYRLSDSSAPHDSRTSPWFASHGYACVRVDLRGSGNSHGLLLDEYLPTEQEDNHDVVDWVAAQPWCSGAVGYIGISWGGFAGLQLATRGPAALKAVISICASDDRYADDVHYRGGALLANDMLPWAAMTLMLNGLPPDPDVVGDGWRELWHHRLQHTPPFIETWLRHRVRDDYWRSGSACERYGEIAAPILAVGGWNDGYVDAVFRLLTHLGPTTRGLIGPWSHGSPEQTAPGPSIGFLQEALRWWDHWLKGIDRGVLAEPPLRAWVQDHVPPAIVHDERPGRWVAWSPGEPHEVHRLHLGDGSLSASPLAGPDVTSVTSVITTPQSAGLDAGAWCPAGMPGDWPGDQRREDGGALCFTSAPLESPLAVLGVPAVTLRVASSHTVANVIVRVSDVAADGSSLLVTRGVLDLTHRRSHEHPEPLVPGEAVDVVVPLKSVGHLVPAGHRLRVAIQTTYWPWVWPVADEVVLTVHAAGSWLDLPIVDVAATAYDPRFGVPVQAEPIVTETLRAGSLDRIIERDVLTGEHRLEIVRVAPSVRLPISRTELGFEDRTVFRVRDGDPDSPMVRCENRAFRRRPGWDVSIHTVSEMTCTRDELVLELSLTAFEADQQVHARTWHLRMPR
jgi:putative CocE/NonD family hydrolase